MYLVASNETPSQDALKLTWNLLAHIMQTPGVGMESGGAQPGGSETNVHMKFKMCTATYPRDSY